MKSLSRWIALSIAALASLAPVAAGGSGESAQKPVTLTLMTPQTWNKPSMEGIISELNSSGTGITVDFQVIPDAQFSNLLRTRVSTGEPPNVTFYRTTTLSRFFGLEGTIAPLDGSPWISRLVVPDGGVSEKGKIYGLPINAAGAPYGIIYNAKLFGELGLKPPANEADFVVAARRLKQAGVTPVLVTAADSWTVGMWVVTLFPAVIANDPSLSWDKLNRGEIRYAKTEGFVRALHQIKRLFDQGLVNADYLSTTYEKGQELMGTGKAGMYLSGSYFAADTIKKFPDAGLLMFAPPTVARPVFASADIQSFNVFLKAGNVEQARKLIDFLAEPAQQKRIDQDWSAIPAFKDVQVTLPPYLQSVVDNYISKGNPPVMAMGSASIVDIAPLVDLAVEMIAGKITPEQVLADWDKKVEEISRERKLPGWN